MDPDGREPELAVANQEELEAESNVALDQLRAEWERVADPNDLSITITTTGASSDPNRTRRFIDYLEKDMLRSDLHKQSVAELIEEGNVALSTASMRHQILQFWLDAGGTETPLNLDILSFTTDPSGEGFSVSANGVDIARIRTFVFFVNPETIRENQQMLFGRDSGASRSATTYSNYAGFTLDITPRDDQTGTQYRLVFINIAAQTAPVDDETVAATFPAGGDRAAERAWVTSRQGPVWMVFFHEAISHTLISLRHREGPIGADDAHIETDRFERELLDWTPLPPEIWHELSHTSNSP